MLVGLIVCLSVCSSVCLFVCLSVCLRVNAVNFSNDNTMHELNFYLNRIGFAILIGEYLSFHGLRIFLQYTIFLTNRYILLLTQFQK